ncbi:MAG: MFS transporter [Candidatus Methylarchaceae archaeon HK01M]|nr:MFS transporter [Candidatus Methylarchaceae archaeon HK01M]
MKKGYLRGISANVLLLGTVSFLNDLSSEMIMPILPIFITALGGGGLIVGLVGGLRDSVTSILNVLAGYSSDKIGRRKVFLTSGYLTSAVLKLLLSFSIVWQHILVFTSFERVGKGLRTAPRDAMIADSMPKEKGKGFGIHRALDTSGAILGSVAVFILFWFLRFEFNLIIFVAAIFAFVSLIPLYLVKERRGKLRDVTLKVGLKELPKPLKLFIFIAGVFSLSNFSYMFFILKAQEAFVGRFSVGVPILLYVLFNISYAVLAAPFGILSDKLGKGKVILVGYLLFSLTSLGFAFFDSLIAFIILFFLYGMVYGIIDGNQRAFVSDLVSEELRATALGTFHTMIGLITLPASLIAGFLFEISPSVTFIFGSVTSLISVILLLVFKNYFKDR